MTEPEPAANPQAHQLVGGTLKRVDSGIVAQCTCGWSSTHFSSLAASAAFMEHQEAAKS